MRARLAEDPPRRRCDGAMAVEGAWHSAARAQNNQVKTHARAVLRPWEWPGVVRAVHRARDRLRETARERRRPRDGRKMCGSAEVDCAAGGLLFGLERAAAAHSPHGMRRQCGRGRCAAARAVGRAAEAQPAGISAFSILTSQAGVEAALLATPPPRRHLAPCPRPPAHISPPPSCPAVPPFRSTRAPLPRTCASATWTT